MAATTEGCNAAGVKKGHLGIPEAVFVKALFSLLAIAMSVALCGSECHYERNLSETFEDYLEEVCIDTSGNSHLLFAKWIENCQDCTCLENGIIYCCSRYGIPMDYDTAMCEMVFVKKACKYIVVRRDNRRIHCYVNTYSG